MIYFDHNATTPLDEQVLEAMLPYLTTFYGNPSSLYRAGRLVRSAINSAREQVAALISVNPGQIIFTSGGTEANNLALKGITGRTTLTAKIAVSALEHPSILETAFSLEHQGWQVSTINADETGRIRPETLEQDEFEDVDLISVMLANNETGAIQNIASISDCLKSRNTLLHTDAVQAIGKIPVDFNDLGVDLMTMSSHKIYGPKGCGALVMDKKVNLTPLVSGGGHENAIRAGTENVAGIIGFGKAAEMALSRIQQNREHLLLLRSQLEAGLDTIPGLEVFCQTVARLPNTVQFGIPGIDGEMLLMQLDQKGFAVSSGSACASGGGKASHVLLAMAIEEPLAKSAIRISLGQTNTVKDVEHFLTTLKSMVSATT